MFKRGTDWCPCPAVPVSVLFLSMMQSAVGLYLLLLIPPKTRHPDYVYFETSSSAPYQIRRIEELIKTADGKVEAKVMCFYRRRDISSSLTVLADKHQSKHPLQFPPLSPCTASLPTP